ncbi:MAG: PQQ-binding-like beta-propeller repeat protein [Phycisphaeraceae bacterium]
MSDATTPVLPVNDEPGRPRWRRIAGGWWVPIALVAAAAGALFLLHQRWEASETQVQHRNVVTAAVTLGTLTLLLGWFVLLATVALAIRLCTLGAVLVLAVAAAATMTFEFGTSGDLVPRVTWRWSPVHDRTLPAITVAPKAAAGQGEGVDVIVPAGAADFHQFLGPRRNGVIENLKLARDWDANPPREVWRRPIGAGWAGFAVAGGRAITQEQRGEEELVVCYALATGEPLWSHADKARYETTIAGVGPRSTPTIDVPRNRVYTLGATGLFNCLDLVTGERLWSMDICQDAGAVPLEWGNSGSPLVVGDQVIVNPGGPNGHSLVAYHADTGKRLWHVGSDPASYASPMLATLAGIEQIIMIHQSAVSGHALGSGHETWRYEWEGRWPKVAQPIVVRGDQLFLTAGYGIGCEMVEFTRKDDVLVPALRWKNIYLKAKFANAVLCEGHIYGLNDGTLVCLKATTGERLWRGKRYGHGQLLLVDDVLLLQAEDGYVALVEAKPVEYRELTRFTPLKDVSWNSPTLAGRYLLVRNAREAACYDLPALD